MPKKRFSIIPDAGQKNFFDVLSFEGKSERYKEIFWFVTSLVVIGVIYLIFFVWGQQIDKNTAKVKEQREEFELRVAGSASERVELESFVARIDAIQGILSESQYRYPSEFFPVFASQLSRYITLTNFNLDVDNAQLTIQGEAASIEALESQERFWGKNSNFILEFQPGSARDSEDDTVQFSASFRIDPRFFGSRIPRASVNETQQN